MEIKSPYTFKELENGNVEVYNSGQRISTGTGASAQAYGFVPKIPKGPAVITTQGVKKDILDPIKEAIQPPTNTSGTTTTSQTTQQPTAEESLLKRELESQKTTVEKAYETNVANLNSILDPLKSKLDVNKQAQIDNIKSQYGLLRNKTEEANARRNKLQETIGVRFGGRYAPEHTADLVQEKVNEGVQAIQELNAQEAQAIATINNAFDEKSYTLAVKQFDELKEIRKERDNKLAEIEKAQVEGLKKLREDQRSSSLAVTVGGLLKQGIKDPATLLEYVNNYEDGKPTGANLTAKELKEMLEVLNTANPDLKAIGDLRTNAIENGAPGDVIDAISSSKTVGDAVRAGKSYLQKGSGDLGEALAIQRDLIARGLTPPSLEQLLVKVANQKAKISDALAGDGTYSGTQIKKIESVNKNISNNATYKKTESMRNFADNVVSALDLGTGVGDITAINQFQKVIDEGAVTRDQDVRLIQGAQSVLNKLKTKVKNLEEGDQLSEETRKQMKETVQKLYASQIKALEKDPYINSVSRELELSKVKKADTILGQLENFGGGVKEEIVKSAQESKSAVDSFITSNPDKAETVAVLYEQGLSDSEVVEYLQTKGLIK